MANELKTTLELDIKPFLDAIKKAANQISTLQELRPKFNTTEFNNLQRQIAGFKPKIDVAINVDKRSLDSVENEINTLGQDPVDIQVLINSEEIQRSVNRIRELRSTALTIPPVTNLKVDSNAQKVIQEIGSLESSARKLADAFATGNFGKINFDTEEAQNNLQFLTDDLRKLGLTIQDLPDFTLDATGIQRAYDFIDQLNSRITEVNRQQLREIFPNLEQDNNRLFQSSLALRNLNEIIEDVKKKAGIDIKFDEQAAIKANQLRDSLLGLPTSKTTKVDLIGEENAIADAKELNTQLNKLPNQKNVKVNLDQGGVKNIGNATSAIGGFTKQLGSGLIASFSGAAIGAAIAGFAAQAVRGIGQAIKSADGLQDALKLAFTQVGAPDIEEALQRANVFALDLSNNFGISAERSKTLLAQVVGLTGEFGAASENITKAAIGIEAATGGLVKAEQAARLFSRSIGNPEDQAALETLAKRFPAIGDAIRSTTDPAERANAVIGNLSGTFAALNEDSQDLFSTLQRLGDTFTVVFGTALAPIADALAPAFQQITDSILANQGTFEQFGQNIADNFVRPLLEQIERLGPSFERFFAGLGDTIAIIGQAGFTTFTASLEALAFVLGITGDLLVILNPLLQQLGIIIQQVLQPIVERLSSDFGGLSGPLEQASDGVLQFSDNAFKLAPILETLKNLLDLIAPSITLAGNLILLALVPSLDALEIALQAILLPFRALNFLFDVGKGIVKEYGDSIRNFVETLATYIPTVFLFVRGLELLGRLSSSPIGINNIGDTKPIEKLDASLFDAVDAGQKFNQQFGVVIPRAASNFGKSLGGATGASKKNTDAAKENTSALQKLIERYQTFNKLLQDNADVRELQATAQEADLEAGLKRQLTDYEKIFREQTKINEAKEDQRLLEQNFAKELGISADNIKKFAEAYLRTGDLATLPIFFDAKDQKSVQDAQRVADEFVKLYKSSIETKTQEQELELKFETAKIEINQQAIATQLGDVETFLQRQLQQLEFGQISVADLNIDGVKNSLIAIRDSAQESLKPFADRLASVRTEIANTINRITELKNANGDNTKEISTLEFALGNLQNRYNVLTSQSKVYQDSVDATTERLNNLGQTIEQAVNQRFDRLSRFQTLELNLDLNADDVNQGLIDIQNGFINAANEISSQFEIARKLIESQQAPQGIANLGLDRLAEAEKNALQNLQAQRIVAIREFQRQNNAIFAIAESFRVNFAGAVAPDNTRAKKAFDERKEEINNELDLLKTNLDLQVISYQEYNEKVLELEREKRDAIKEYDKEVEQNRLDGFKRLAEDALPAINKQLEVASAELTVLLNNNASDFTDIANKSLENLALVGAQSLGIALQQAQSLEEVQKLFIKSLVRNTLQALQVQLVGAILQGIFRDVEKAGTLGLITGALIGGALTALFLKAEQEILKLAGFESGGYTGDVGTKDVAGVVHGQEYVVNAKNTRENRPLLDWINKGNSAESFFKNSSPDVSVDNYVDTKAINASINTLAYTMDARLSSLETTVDRAIRQNATLTKSANQLDVSVYSDPGTAIKYMKRMGKIKGLS